MPLDFDREHPQSILDLIERDLPENPCWIEPAILPKRGKLLFGGHAKIGKSFLMLEIARALATGSAPLGCAWMHVPKPVRVLVVEQELGEWGLQKRVRQVLRTENRDFLRTNFHYKSQMRGLKLNDPRGPEHIARWVKEAGAQVLILDPIGKLHEWDENDSSQINRLFSTVERILDKCSDLDLSIIISHHFGKPNRDPRVEGDPFSPYNFRGSSKFYDDPDTLVTCVRKDVDPKRKWWLIDTKWETRQGGDLEDPFLRLAFNRHGDLRVRVDSTPNTPDKIGVKRHEAPTTPFAISPPTVY
jgi:RecA-family ATPase